MKPTTLSAHRDGARVAFHELKGQAGEGTETTTLSVRCPAWLVLLLYAQGTKLIQYASSSGLPRVGPSDRAMPLP